MTTPNQSHDTLQRMEAMLRRCRRRIVMAETATHLYRGLDFFLKSVLVLLGGFLCFRILDRAVSMPFAIGWMHVLGVACAVGAVIFGRALSQGVFGRHVKTAHAAERLDLAQATHNRIATAIALLRDGNDSEFARAAVRDGFKYLERLQAEEPHVERGGTSWFRKAASLALSLGMALASVFLRGEPAEGVDDGLRRHVSSPVARLESQLDASAPDVESQTPRHEVPSDATQRAGQLPAEEGDLDEDDRGARPDPKAESQSEGPEGRHAAGNSRSSQSSSDSRSAASGAGAKAEPGTTEPGKPKKRRDRKKPATSPPPVDQKDEKAGSINARGSSGTGSMRTVQNEWSSTVKAKSDDSDDFDQEEEPDEEMDPDKQRLGMQPALKNRTSQVSRELSLSMGNGLNKDMMKGRGGPSAQKKARGVGSMIMGVPVPGFVKGRLLPGPTKSTQEEVEPSPREGDHALASQLQRAIPEEAPQEHYRPSAAMRVQARDYLIKYHAENEDRRNGVAADEPSR